MPPEIVLIELVKTVVPAAVVTLLGWPFARVLARWLEPRARATPPSLHGIEERLARIEGAVDSIAVEVERVAEAHRYTAKLLAERGNAAGAVLPRV
jgi:hypothetical protein